MQDLEHCLSVTSAHSTLICKHTHSEACSLLFMHARPEYHHQQHSYCVAHVRTGNIDSLDTVPSSGEKMTVMSASPCWLCSSLQYFKHSCQFCALVENVSISHRNEHTLFHFDTIMFLASCCLRPCVKTCDSHI